MGFCWPVSRTALQQPLSPADQNAIEQQQRHCWNRRQQQRDMLRHSTSAPSLPEAPLQNQTVSVFGSVYPAGERHSAPALCRAKTDDHPAPGCMTLPDIRERVRDVTQDYLSGIHHFAPGCRNRIFPEERWSLPSRREGGSRHAGGHEENAIRMAFPGRRAGYSISATLNRVWSS